MSNASRDTGRDTSLGALRNFLVTRYDELKGKLTRRLGNADLAGDALQDTWIRLNGKESDPGPVQSPAAYLLRMAFNVAVDQQRAQSRLLSYGEIESLVEAAEPAPGPAEIVEARSECDALTRVMETLPARRRQILLAVRLDGTPQKEIAERLGISLRLVERELQKAHEYCAAHLKTHLKNK